MALTRRERVKLHLICIWSHLRGIAREFFFLTIMLSIIGLTGCAGYQNVKVYERVDGEVVMTQHIKGIIFGTSGQTIKTDKINISKQDGTDVAAKLLRDGVTAGVAIASGGNLT